MGDIEDEDYEGISNQNLPCFVLHTFWADRAHDVP